MPLLVIYTGGIEWKSTAGDRKKIAKAIEENSKGVLGHDQCSVLFVDHESVRDNSWGAKLRKAAARFILSRYFPPGLAASGFITDLLWDVLDIFLFPNIQQAMVDYILAQLRKANIVYSGYLDVVLICHSGGSILSTLALEQRAVFKNYMRYVAFIGSPFGSVIPPVRGLTAKFFEDELVNVFGFNEDTGIFRDTQLINVYSPGDPISGPMGQVVPAAVLDVKTPRAIKHTDVVGYIETVFDYIRSLSDEE